MEPFFLSFLKFSIFHPTAVCRENIMQMPLIFFPYVYIVRQNSLSAATWWLCEEKKSGLVEWKSVFYVHFEGKMCRAWFLNLFGLHLKFFFFFNPVISLDLLASEKRSEFVTRAKGSVSVWLVLAVVPYSCWRWTVAPELILPCQPWPRDVTIPSYLSPHNWCWLETSWNGAELLGCLFHVT